jgi:RNA polymerase sigma factor (sigma-70 family)
MRQEAAQRQSELGDLYRAFAPRLEEIVRLGVGAADPVVEDACQFAWGRLVHHGDRVRRSTARAWLATTASREAVRINSRRAREVSLRAAGTDEGVPDPRATVPGPEEVALAHERLDLLGRLSERQQRILWLHALGMSYAEIAAETGCTRRTVERQLLRARRAARASA